MSILIAVAIFILGYLVGGHVQHSKTGYHYELHDEAVYDFELGTIRWQYVTETVGLPILDPGTTIIEFDNRRLYTARRAFQESAPYARDITVTEAGLNWQDGDYHYSLDIRVADDDK